MNSQNANAHLSSVVSAKRPFVCAGAPIPPSLVSAARKILGIRIVAGWGMTETGISTTTDMTGEKVTTSDGYALPVGETRIVDFDGNTLPPGEVGRLEIRSSAMFVAYFKRPEMYNLDEDGWFDTGDLAFMDEAGYIRITGRHKDIIIRGGENIPVVEIEALIYAMEEVSDVALVAMPDVRFGEKVCAFVSLSGKGSFDFDIMVGRLRGDGVAAQYLPERLEIVDEMPRTASGKIQKYELREQAKQFGAPKPRRL